MEPSSNSASDVLEWIYSWIPRGGRIEAQASSPNMSRDFWMPDRSCRFCFDCESEFGLFNRRHHCRLCGKVFCGKCSLNTIPASVEEGAPDEEGERVRVCNYCYKLHLTEQDSTPPTEENPTTLTPSLSAQSVNSSALGASASVVPLSPQQAVSGGPPGDRLPCMWDEELDESSEQMHAMRTDQGGSRVLGSMSRRARDQPPSPDRYRSEDDEDEFGRQLEDEDEEEGLPIAHELQDQAEDYEDESSSELAQDPRDSEGKIESSIYSTQSSIGHNPPSDDGSDSVRRGESGDGKGCSESTEENENAFPYGDEIPRKDNPPLNFEKNPLIWIPPPPADDQDDDDDDDAGTTPVEYDDDDEEGGAGWAVPRSPGSVGSVDTKKEKTVSDEHKKAMRAQVHMHFENLVAQLLQQKGVEVGEPGNPDSWLEIVTSLSWLAASLVKPDTSNGGGMDPGTYVKVKCVASGRPSESALVKGIVFRKNVAHKRMTSRYKNPRLLLLAGALEYQRVSNQLSSLDTLLNQENEHLKMTVARIEAHHPNVLLVEKSVSRYAQDILLNKEISLVLNVKRPLLDRIARCVGGQVVSSPDNLVTPKAVHCDLFHVERFVEEHGSAGGGKQLTKFLMFFEGCPKPLGCTILLKGANGDFLKKVKEVVQLAVFSAYHLQLETSFLEDEGATLPGHSTNVSVHNRHTIYERSISAVPGVAIADSHHGQQVRSGQSSTVSISPFLSRANSIGASAALSNLDTASTTTNAGVRSASSSCGSSATNSPGTSPAQSSFGYPSEMSRSSSIGGTSTTTYHHASNGVYPGGQSWQGVSGLSVSLKRGVQDGNLDGEANLSDSPSSRGDGSLAFEIKALEVNTVRGSSGSSNSDQIVTTTASMVSKGTIRESGHDYHIEPEQVQAHLRVLIQNEPNYRQSEVERSKEDFPPSPSDRQSILVQFSKRCLAKGAAVKQPNFLRIKYYGNGDKPLGMFLRDTIFDTNRPCEQCDESGDKHVLSYTHRQGSLTITVHKDSNNPLSGEKSGRIWMWHRCLRCALENGVPPATSRVIMSDAAWGLSFGKFLELSFSTHPAATRLAACGHSLHRDCLRFYGFGSMVACFRYSEITIHSFYLPPLKLEFNLSKQQGWLQKEKEEVDKQAHDVFDKVFSKLLVLGGKIKSARALCGNSATLDAQRRIVALETLLQNEKSVLEEALSRSGQDILKLNRLRRDLLISSLQWDWRLEYLVSKCLPTRRRNTGSVGDPSMLSAKELDIGPGSVKMNEASEAERESSSPDVMSCDPESTSRSFLGSSPSDQTIAEEKPSEKQLTGIEQDRTSVRENNCLDPLVPTSIELTDGNGLDFRLPMDEESRLVEELLDSMDVTPHKGRISGSKSVIVDATSVLKISTSLLETNGEAGSTGAFEGEHNASVEDLDSATARASPPRFLEGEITARRALSEGNYPLLADLSDTLDAAWTGDAGSVDVPGVDESREKVVDTVQANEECLDPESQGSVQEGTSVDQPPAEAGAQDVVSHDAGDTSDGQVSIPSSPVKLDSSEELTGLTEGWMGDPFASFFKSYSRTSSILSNSSDGKVPPPGLPSKIPASAQLDADGNARRVLLPQGHDDVVVAVYDEEPTSMIAYALSTEEHYVHVTDLLAEKEKAKEKDQDRDSGDLSSEQALSHPLQIPDASGEVDGAVRENFGSNTALNSRIGSEIENPLISTKASQLVKKTISFCEDTPSGKVKFQVTCYFAKQFDALRKKCCMGSTEYIRSLSRCKKWGAQGGKSNVFFAKTADDRFVVKQVTKTELTSFLDFASSYFKYLFEALINGNPTCLAKIFGVYEVKTIKGGKETKMDVLVMENLLYDRHITRVYDLKGSVRSRYNADADSETGKSQVKLDQNLVEELPTNPIYVGKNAKRLLERAIWNDTHFLSLVFVMDYSLLVGVDVERKELVVGIIDFIRQYTWDKHLETWVKASGFLGGPKNAPPTVISPKQYKKRFRKAMSTYFLMVPDQWIPPPQLTISQNANYGEDSTITIATKGEDGEMILTPQDTRPVIEAFPTL